MLKGTKGKKEKNMSGEVTGEKICIKLTMNLNIRKMKAWKENIPTNSKKISYDNIIIIILANALKKNPIFTSMDEEEIKRIEEINVNITV